MRKQKASTDSSGAATRGYGHAMLLFCIGCYLTNSFRHVKTCVVAMMEDTTTGEVSTKALMAGKDTSTSTSTAATEESNSTALFMQAKETVIKKRNTWDSTMPFALR